jgi:type VI secretion system protein ImpJ
MNSRVLWKNGIFLTPQHYQQADRQLESLLRPVGPHDWGVVSLQLDTAALAEGRIGLRRCRAILSDGTPVDVGRDLRTNRDGDDPLPAAQPFELRSGPGRLSVWLKIPERVADKRYLETPIELADIYNPANKRTVLVGHKNLSFAFTGQPLEGHTVLKLAEVDRDTANVPVISSEYVPPCRVLAGSPFFAQLIERLVVRLEGRVRDRARLKDRIEEITALGAMMQTLPVLSHLQQPSVQEATHPQVLFTEMLRLAGALSLLSKDPPTLPAYLHEDPYSCFRALDLQIAVLLGLAAPSQVDAFTLRIRPGFEDNIIWDATVPRGRPAAGERMYLVLSGDFDFQHVVEQIPRRAKLGGPRSLDNALANGWPGLKLIPEPAPEALRARTRSAVAAFFQLPTGEFPKRKTGVQDNDRAAELWAEVHEQGQLSLYIPEELLRRPLPQVDIVYIKEGKSA